MGLWGQECSTDSNLDPVISRVAVLPHPPQMVPELVGGGDRDADAVRAQGVAVARELAAVASRWVAVGADVVARVLAPDVVGTFRGFGVDVTVSLGSVDSPIDPSVPLPALIAGWLREQGGADEVTVYLVESDLPPAECADLGAELAAGTEDTALLVLGDGSHRHGAQAVGRPDERASSFDATVAAALAEVDLDGLLALDPALAVDLGAIGRAPWQVLAGAVRADGRAWRCARSHTVVPFGVAYHLALWEPV